MNIRLLGISLMPRHFISLELVDESYELTALKDCLKPAKRNHTL
jgi:hypothetical protein